MGPHRTRASAAASERATHSLRGEDRPTGQHVRLRAVEARRRPGRGRRRAQAGGPSCRQGSRLAHRPALGIAGAQSVARGRTPRGSRRDGRSTARRLSAGAGTGWPLRRDRRQLAPAPERRAGTRRMCLPQQPHSGGGCDGIFTGRGLGTECSGRRRRGRSGAGPRTGGGARSGAGLAQRPPASASSSSSRR